MFDLGANILLKHVYLAGIIMDVKGYVSCQQ